MKEFKDAIHEKKNYEYQMGLREPRRGLQRGNNRKGVAKMKESKPTMDLEIFEEVDYSSYFITDQAFASKEELKEWAKSTAREHNMFLIVQSSRRRNIYISCERYGKERVMRSNIDVKSQKFTGTKKCRCPFMLIGHMKSESVWRISVSNGKHNHPPAKYHHRHSMASRLTQDEYEIKKTLSKSHVKSKEILDHLRREDHTIKTSLEHLYNARNKIKVEVLDGHTVVQNLMHYIAKNEYLQWHRVDPMTNETIDFMFAHPRSVKLLKAFPYVLLMDTTYKSNRYEMHLLEIIGVTPVGKNFNVAIAFMKNESEEHYCWILNNLRNLFDGGILPSTIVTDRELRLMKALDHIFPESYHLLCRFHINKNVQLMATKLMGGNKGYGMNFSRRPWKTLINSLTVEEFDANYKQLLWDYQRCPLLLTYLNETWLAYKERFVLAWTDRVFHLGNRTMTRVESVQSSLKTWLTLSTGRFDTVWSQLHSQIESQINGVLTGLAKSSRVRKHVVSYPCFRTLTGVVTLEALSKMDQERMIGTTSGVWKDPSRCTCYLRNTHGLPCAHEIAQKEHNRELFFSDDIHVFWRTLSIEAPPPTDTAPDHHAEIRGLIEGYVQELYTRPIKEQKHMSNIMFSYLYPQASHLDEPFVQQPRGRPKKNPIATDPLGWEYTCQKFSIHKSSSRSDKAQGRSSSDSKGHGHSSSGSVGRESIDRGHGSSSSSDKSQRLSSSCVPVLNQKPFPEFNSILPHFLIPHIQSYIDVIGDENCGYRCVAQVVYGNEHQWITVRQRLFNHIEARWELYVKVFGEDDAGEQYMCRVLASICHWINDKAPMPKWMILSDMGLVIATYYSAIVLELSATQCILHLPLIWEQDTAEIAHVIPIMYDAKAQHFIQLTLRDNCPLPPINPQWNRYRDPSVESLQQTLRSRIRRWELLAAHM